MNNLKSFVKTAKKFAYDEQKRTSMPLSQHIDLSTGVGVKLAKKLNADVDIVKSGTYLMDCLIGKALKQKRLPDHIKMSAIKAEELMKNSKLTSDEKENIKHCVLEHHGVEKFYSIESEICCNADCYRFVSIKGFTYAMRFLRDMPFEDLVKLLNNKVEEKWNALTLKECKKELKPQYLIIKSFLKELQK